MIRRLLAALRRRPDVEIYRGWLIEHDGRRTIHIRCADCNWHTGGTDLTRPRLSRHELVERTIDAIEQTGIHNHQHQEDS